MEENTSKFCELKLIAFIAIICLQPLSLNLVHAQEEAPTNQEKHNSKNTSCPLTKEQTLRISQIEIKVDTESFFPDKVQCNSVYIEQLLKSIEQLKSIEFAYIPKSIDNKITQSLKNPWQYILKQNLTSIAFDKSSRALASYDLNYGTMYVTKQYFDSSPSLQASTILHEAAHSNPSTPWHDVCYQGQLGATVGGCDSSLEDQPAFAGAYSIEYWFLRLVASAGDHVFSKKELAVARQEARELLGHRFNHTFQHGHFNDVLLTRNENNQVLIFDPLFKEFTPLTKSSEPVIKIQKNRLNHGLFLYNEKNKVSTWNPDSRQTALYEHFDFDQLQGNVRSIFSPLHPEMSVNRNFIIDQQGNLLQEGLDDEQNRRYLPYLKESVFGLKSIEVLYGQKHLVLKADGQIDILNSKHDSLDLPQKGLSEKITKVVPTPDAMAFYSLSESGMVYFSKISSQGQSPFGYGAEQVSFSLDELQAPKGAMAHDLAEGISVRALVDDNGQLTIKNLTKNKKISAQSKPTSEPIMVSSQNRFDQVVISKTTRFPDEHKLIKNEKEMVEFKNNCQTTQNDKDPWLKRPIGLNPQGEVVVWSQNTCRVLFSDVEDFQLAGSGIAINPYGYNLTILRITFKNGQTLEVHPYHLKH